MDPICFIALPFLELTETLEMYLLLDMDWLRSFSQGLDSILLGKAAFWWHPTFLLCFPTEKVGGLFFMREFLCSPI